jgi:cellulose biosynthesis protein BcsQ
VLGDKACKSLSTSSLPVLRTEIGLRQAYAEAVGEGEGVTNYEPSSHAAQEMRDLVDEALRFAKGKQ